MFYWDVLAIQTKVTFSNDIFSKMMKNDSIIIHIVPVLNLNHESDHEHPEPPVTKIATFPSLSDEKSISFHSIDNLPSQFQQTAQISSAESGVTTTNQVPGSLPVSAKELSEKLQNQRVVPDIDTQIHEGTVFSLRDDWATTSSSDHDEDEDSSPKRSPEEHGNIHYLARFFFCV